jgi:hypothetical protein
VKDDSLRFRQRWDDRIDVGSCASYRFDRALPKPCVHPLVTPRGHVLSGFEMSDHVWHRGLWFAIKFVNGANFWEENSPFGVQVSDAQPRCEMLAAAVLRITHRLHWMSDATGLVIRETRVLIFRGDAVIDWSTQLCAAQDLVLDRTPYTTWGGYGGLAFRASRELHEASFLLPGGETVSGIAGQRHEWCILQAKVDGGPDQQVSIAMVDHPANSRTPSPWYCKSGNGFDYMNAALLFHEPMSLKRGDVLRLRYRVMWRDGAWSADEFAELAGDFRNSTDSEHV